MVTEVRIGLQQAVMFQGLGHLRRIDRHVHAGFTNAGEQRKAETVAAIFLVVPHQLDDAVVVGFLKRKDGKKSHEMFFHRVHAVAVQQAHALALMASGNRPSQGADIPLWVVGLSGLAMSIGTYAGGWRIMRTLGSRIVPLTPPQISRSGR
jgi:phosphate/sulfate permease